MHHGACSFFLRMPCSFWRIRQDNKGEGKAICKNVQDADEIPQIQKKNLYFAKSDQKKTS